MEFHNFFGNVLVYIEKKLIQIKKQTLSWSITIVEMEF